jgi:hypothetical protein
MSKNYFRLHFLSFRICLYKINKSIEPKRRKTALTKFKEIIKFVIIFGHSKQFILTSFVSWLMQIYNDRASPHVKYIIFTTSKSFGLFLASENINKPTIMSKHIIYLIFIITFKRKIERLFIA